MGSGVGKPTVPQFDDRYDGPKMRALTGLLELFFKRFRIDGAILIGGGRVITKYFGATVTWDPGNIASGAQATTTVTVTGVRLADLNTVTVGFTKDLQGMQLTAYVSADDTLGVVLRNGTAGALDLDSGSLTVGVWKHG